MNDRTTMSGEAFYSVPCVTCGRVMVTGACCDGPYTWEEKARTLEFGLQKAERERDEARESTRIARSLGANFDRERLEELEHERDEARAERDNLLAVIHRDGGHYVGEHGLTKAVADAHATWAAVVCERDEARAEVERLRAEHAADLSRLDGWRLRAGVAERWQRVVAEGTGYINHAEGQDGYEVADAETIVAAWKRARRAEDESTDVALRQREACAAALEGHDGQYGLSGSVARKMVRATPLVTEETE